MKTEWKLLTSLKHWARQLKRDILAVWIAARDPRIHRTPKLLALLVAGYAFSPIDLIPDFIPVLGYVDDLLILPLGVAVVIKLIPTPLMNEFKAAAIKLEMAPVSYITALVVIILWTLLPTLFIYRVINNS